MREKENSLNQSSERSHYQVYVLHLWQNMEDATEHSATWRFILEEPKTGQRRGFKDLGELMDFFKMELQRQDATDNSFFKETAA